MESGRNKDPVSNSAQQEQPEQPEQPQQVSTQVEESQQPLSPAPSSTKATATQEKSTCSELHDPPPTTIDYWWGWDILGLILSLAVLIAIIVILSVYDGKPQPRWRWISLNTLLSWLSTVGKACVLFPLSAGLSQLKWVWFTQRKRPLSDLRVFDNASRGIYGSAELLWALRMRHFVVLGALAVLFAIGFEPFVQNLVHYSPDLVVDTSQISHLANVTNYRSIGPLQAGAIRNVYNSIFNSDPGRPWAIPQYTCPTGNCTWDPVASLAVRALCSNVTSSIEEECEHVEDDGNGIPYDNCTVLLPNGASAYYAGGGDVEAIASQVEPPSQPIVYTNATNTTLPVIQRIEAVGASDDEGWYIAPNIRDNARYVATECVLEPIVRSVKASVNEAVYHETILAEWTHAEIWYDTQESADGYFLIPDWDEGLGARPGQNFTLFPKAQATLKSFLEGIFSGQVHATELDLAFQQLGPQTGYYATADVMQALFYGNLTGCAVTKNDRFGCAMRNVADAISKSFRDQPYIDNAREADMAVGYMRVNATIIRVRWQWLTLPLLVWLLATVTWLGTEWKTRRGKIQKWSDNPLPLLFLYRAGEDDRTDHVQSLSGEAYEHRAKSIHAQLYTKEGRAAFVE